MIRYSNSTRLSTSVAAEVFTLCCLARLPEIRAQTEQHHDDMCQGHGIHYVDTTVDCLCDNGFEGADCRPVIGAGKHFIKPNLWSNID